MSFQAMAWAVKQRCAGPTGKIVLLCLANYADEAGSCFPKQTQIAEQASCSLRSVKYALQHLRSLGLITDTKRRRKDGTQCASRYRLALPNDRVQTVHPVPPIRVQNTTGQSAKSAPFLREDTITEPITKDSKLVLKKWETLSSSLAGVIEETRKRSNGRTTAHAK